MLYVTIILYYSNNIYLSKWLTFYIKSCGTHFHFINVPNKFTINSYQLYSMADFMS